MAKVDIVETTLQDGTTGKCAYVDGITFTDFKMTIQKHLIEGNTYSISFLFKSDNTRYDGGISMISGGTEVSILGRTGRLQPFEWRKYQMRFTSDGSYPVLYFPNNEYYLYALMVEDGNIASTWSASANDTRVDTESIIDQKSESITIAVKGEVLEKVGEDFVQKNNVIAEINAQVDPEKGTSEVQINAGAINLNGVVTANETFKIDTDGSMEATGGRIGGLFVCDNGFSGSGFDMTQAEIVFDDETGLPIVQEEPKLRLTGITDEYGWNNTSYIEYTGLGVKSNSVDVTTTKKAFDLDIRPLRKVGRNTVDAKIKFHTIYLADKEGVSESISIDGSEGEIKAYKIKTYSGANLDGNVKMKLFGSATGSSSAMPSVNISSLPDKTILHVVVRLKIDSSTNAYFSQDIIKDSSGDYLYNVGGYHYDDNNYGSAFAYANGSRVIVSGWSKVVANKQNLPVQSSSTLLFVYIKHL